MIEYVIDRPAHLVRVRLCGSTTSSDLARHLARVHSDPDYEPSFNILFHVEDDVDGPILAELPSVGLQLEAVARLQNATKWAVVMRPGLQRTVVEFLLLGLKLAGVKMHFFDNDQDAVAWLDRDRSPSVPNNA